MSGKDGKDGDEKGKEGGRKHSPLTALLFLTVTLALAVKFLINVPFFRQFFSGYGKFALLPVLFYLGYIGIHRKS
ncbi:MAG: hypothetical protein BWY01_00264 [Synergistetes bacterium ADurb.Bin155]|jgi:hypothetical protein|nr:hypothetical protein [Synergistales bacterium]NMD18099.1 hypothetical protein [Synergistaceae bacterium]OQB47055.1 MAG: hypothetical protein BWY01_00264 [Synergistetes bacterium ADurb.Bin155]MBP8995423.1 hypothetical protein [Synergistales bacterium]HOC81829.1 hypothetical protein [Synergistales bacterium]